HCCSSFMLTLGLPEPPRLLSFPTRRSSDLVGRRRQPHARLARLRPAPQPDRGRARFAHGPAGSLGRREPATAGAAQPARERGARSEEHTSELQSRENLVCRLLLEKKNTSQC